MSIEINYETERYIQKDFNTYYIFQESSANPSGYYKVNPYLDKDRILVSDNNSINDSSAVNINNI